MPQPHSFHSRRTVSFRRLLHLFLLQRLSASSLLIPSPTSTATSGSPLSRSRLVSPSSPCLFLQRRPLLISSAATLLLSGGGITMADESSSSQRIINWGIIGLGDVCAKKSGPAFLKLAGARLVAVHRRTPNAAKKWVEQQQHQISYPITPYSTLSEFLSHPNLDAIYISTPPGSHLSLAKQIAEATTSVRAIYVEKPVGRCASETEAIVREFESRKKIVYSAYISRAYDRTVALRKLLREGAVGEKVTEVTYGCCGSGVARGMERTDVLPWRLRAEESGGGLIMDVGCHLVDRLDYLLGPILNVRSVVENRGSVDGSDVEDFVRMTGEIGGCDWNCVESEGAKVTCCWDFTSEESVDELIIKGEGGSLRMKAMSADDPIEVRGKDGQVLESIGFKAPEHTAQNLIQLVTDELRGVEMDDDGKRALSKGDNAIRTSKVLDEVLGAYYNGRGDQFWTRPETWSR